MTKEGYGLKQIQRTDEENNNKNALQGDTNQADTESRWRRVRVLALESPSEERSSVHGHQTVH